MLETLHTERDALPARRSEIARELAAKNEEWTPEGESVLMSLDKETGDRTYFHCTNSLNAEIAADAHNFALAAEERRANDSITENVRIMNELAAEREKVKGELANGNELFRKTIELEQKLAAEREHRKLVDRVLDSRCLQLRKMEDEFASEREIRDAISRTNGQLEETLREKIKMLVELAKGNKTGCGTCSTIVSEGEK